MQTTITTDLIHQTLSELVVALPSAMQVFTKYDLDYCCGGKDTLELACLQKGLNPQEILTEIENTTERKGSIPLHVQDWSTGFLIDFIVENYHRYVRNSIPVLNELLVKVCSVHAEENPALLSIQTEFKGLADELLSHMQKEELILFPALREHEETHGQSTNPLISMIKQPIAVMEDEHQIAGDYLKVIRNLSNHYTPPADACPTFQLTYQKLAEFDQELINHIHLENNVLFKRA
jgi:regulator of cell morphogenesis and NO signaling